MATTMRVDEKTRDDFAELSAKTGRPMTELLQHAFEALQRKIFFDEFNSAYQQVRQDEGVWQQVLQEREIEAGSLSDNQE